MPEIVTIGDEEIYFRFFNRTRIFKRKAGQPKNEVLIFNGGIGNFIDILYQNELLTARTSEGWFFSKTKGESWFSEEEAEEHDISLNQKFKGEVTFMKSYLKRHVYDESKFNHTFEFNVEERINAINHPCLELIELEDDSALDDFIDQCLKIKDITDYRKTFIFSNEKADFIQKSLCDLHLKNDKFVRRRMLQHVPQHFFFIADFGVENLRNFDYNVMRSKQSYDTKLFIINDLMLFFKKEKGRDFIESTLRNLYHIASHYGVRIISTYSKSTQELDQEAIQFISNFKEELIDHFVQIPSGENENEILIKEN
jgi:hypothetical protein